MQCYLKFLNIPKINTQPMKIFGEWLNEAATKLVSKNRTLADEARDALKKAGFKRNQVSVQYRNGADTVLHFIIKDVSVDIKDVEKVASKFENTYFDNRTGGLLRGGNTLVFVEYDYMAADKERKRLAKVMDPIIKDGLADENKRFPIGKGYEVFWIASDAKRNPEELYSYSHKGKMFSRGSKDFIRPLWRLFRAAGN